MPHPRGGYRLADGSKCPGTTTITGRFKESGGLLQWAFKQGQSGAEYLYEKRDEAAEAGTIAHAFVERHIKRQTFSLDTDAVVKEFSCGPDTAEKAVNAYMAYLSWQDSTNLAIVAQEISMVSEKHRYGGTPDAIGIDKEDRHTLIDWKTSNAVYTDNLVQLAAYKGLWDENHPDKPITGGFHLCRFAKQHGDFEHRYFPGLPEAWKVFLLYRQAYDIDRQLKKRAA